jgi:hypothetical protein
VDICSGSVGLFKLVSFRSRDAYILTPFCYCWVHGRFCIYLACTRDTHSHMIFEPAVKLLVFSLLSLFIKHESYVPFSVELFSLISMPYQCHIVKNTPCCDQMCNTNLNQSHCCCQWSLSCLRHIVEESSTLRYLLC